MEGKKLDEIKIYYSKINIVFLISCSICCLCIACYFLLEKHLFLGIPCAVIGSLSLNIGIKRLLENNPQIIITHQGIQLTERKIIYWENINHTTIREEHSSNSPHYYLDIYAKNKTRKGKIIATIEITDLSISNRKLEVLIKKYHTI